MASDDHVIPKDFVVCEGASPDVAVAGALGAASVTATERTMNVRTTFRGVAVETPYAFDARGNPVCLSEAVDAAKLEHASLHPDRRGLYVFAALASLLAWAKRYRKPDSAAFLESPAVGASIRHGAATVVIDELPIESLDGPHRALRGRIVLTLSDRLVHWLQAGKTWMSVDAFADFVARASDEITTADVTTMINNLEIKSETTYKRTVDERGNTKLVAEDMSGPTTRIPSAFQFHVPVFAFDDEANGHSFTARLVMKLDKGRPMFQYEVTDFAPRMAEVMAAIHAEVSAVIPQTYMGIAP